MDCGSLIANGVDNSFGELKYYLEVIQNYGLYSILNDCGSMSQTPDHWWTIHFSFAKDYLRCEERKQFGDIMGDLKKLTEEGFEDAEGTKWKVRLLAWVGDQKELHR